MQHTIDINSGARRLIVPGGRSLFDTLKDHGVLLPSVCGGRGLCGRCRLRIREGATPLTPVEEKKLSPEELARGVRLGCQVEVNADLSIDVPVELLAVERFRGRVERIRNLTYDVRELRIRLIDPPRMRFAPGQYVWLNVPAHNGSPNPVSRAYSLASAPSDDGWIELIVRLAPGGICTTWIFTMLADGDEVAFDGPCGDFKLTGTDREMIWVAGGSGMAPFWSMIRHLKETRIRRKCTYFFGAVARRDLFLADELRELERELDWFTFVPALSAPAAGDDWAGQRGLITEVLDRCVEDDSPAEAYLCGSGGMIDAAVKVLGDKGIGADRTFYDKFQ